MVVEGGERVRVGELHVVTLNGGTVGRESTNAVHLPDLNISKVSESLVVGEGDRKTDWSCFQK